MRFRFPRFAAFAAATCFLFAASEAYAWGPATHAQLATDLLGQLALLPAAVAGILARYASSYVFGNLAADVVFAKRLSKIRQFCHHWSTGFRLLDAADSEDERAFAFGYLSHLAADTIAHGKFVPRQLSVTRTTVQFGHIYWEMRADALMSQAAWRTLATVSAADNERHHQVLAEHLSATLLPYQYNRRLFDGINRLMVQRYWANCIRAVERRSRWHLPDGLVAGYRRESVDRIACVLTRLDKSPVLRSDPSGRASLYQARQHRRDSRRLRRRGLPTERMVSEAAAALAPAPSGPRAALR